MIDQNIILQAYLAAMECYRLQCGRVLSMWEDTQSGFDCSVELIEDFNWDCVETVDGKREQRWTKRIDQIVKALDWEWM